MSDYDEAEKVRLVAKYERHIQRFHEMVAAINAMFDFHIVTAEQKDDLLLKVQKKLRLTMGKLNTVYIPLMSQADIDSLNARINEDIRRRNNV